MNSIDVVKGFSNNEISFNDNLNIDLSNNSNLILNLNDSSKQININVVKESSARLYLFLNYTSEESVYNINVADLAKLEIVCIQKDKSKNVFNSNVASSAALNMFFIDFSDDSNSKFETKLVGEYAEYNLKTASINLKNSSSKFYIDTKHLNKATYSNAVSRSVVLGEGKYINDTIGFIEKGCSFSKCHQDTKAIVLGDKAVAECNPVLLIDEYDVEASHAAAVGQINEDELYYMQSRGLTFEQCLALLVNGFLITITDSINNDEIKELLIEEIHNILNV